jgi:hypothetical protein
MELKKLTNLLDLINMFVGVYYDKYLGFDYCEYLKWSYFGYQKRLELFEIRDHEKLDIFVNNFFHLVDGKQNVSKYEFYTKIAYEILKLSDEEVKTFAELMLL